MESVEQKTLSRVHPFEQVESACQSYQQEQANGGPPTLLAYLGKVKGALKSAALRNLLQIDIERRRSQGEQPKPEDYVPWLPEHEAIIRQEFVESVSVHRSSLSLNVADTEALRRNQPPEAAARQAPGSSVTRLGEYHLLRQLGRGGMGMVYEAAHVQRKDRVALKVLPEVDGDRLHRFKREFRSLADINHPNLVGLHSLECDGDQWFFTMDLIDGVDFLSYVRPHNQLDHERLAAAFAQLATGVMALHANLVAHCDIKPSNVMVDRQGKVILLDFGLIVELEQGMETVTGHQIAGTPAYMSPQQARGEPPKPSCDWYAVGALLYESLCGRVPFDGQVLQILHAKQEQDPPPLPDDQRLPDDLCRLCMGLLARNPQDRPDAMQIARAVSIRTEDVRSSKSSENHPLIGRERQSQHLAQALDGFQTSELPVAVFVSGRSGEGKTTLCEAFLEPLFKDDQCVVMAGRCYDRESVPYKALDSTIDALCSYLRSIPEKDVAALLPRDVSMLVSVFPVFHRVAAISQAPQKSVEGLEEQEIRTRAFAALRELLCRISDRHPIILFIDDLQWGDADSAEVLLQALRPPQGPRVFLLGTYRSDEADDSPFLQAWEQVRQRRAIEIERRDVAVAPFSQEQCTQFIVELVQHDSEAVRRRSVEFFEQTGGNPFLLTELAGCFDPQTDSFRPLPVHEVIEEKLERLPPEAKRLLEVTAVSGQSLDLEEVSAVSGHDAAPTATLTRMRSERLIRFLGSDHHRRIDTYHDRIRETVLREMDAAVKQGLHHDLGVYIEQSSGGLGESQLEQLMEGEWGQERGSVSDRLFDLSFHFDAAGEQKKACAYGLLAGDQARGQFSLEVAARQYRIARRNFGACHPSTQRRILMKLGDTLTLLGRYDDAEECLNEAHQKAGDKLDRWEIEALQGKLLVNACRYGASAERFGNTLLEMGFWVPQSKLGYAYGIAKEALIQAYRTWFVGEPKRRQGLPRREELLRTQLLDGLLYSTWFRSTLLTLWCHLAGLNESERIVDAKIIASHYAKHGLFVTPAGLGKRGMRYDEKSLAWVSEHDLSAVATNFFFRGVVCYTTSTYEEGKPLLRRASEITEQSGDQWLAMVSRLHHILSDYRLGNFTAALEGTLEAFQLSVRLGDYNTGNDFLNVASLITGGNFRYDRMAASVKPIPDNRQATNQGLQAEARWHLHHGRTAEALQLAQQAYDIATSHLVINHITASTFPLLAEAIRKRAEQVEAEDSTEADRLLKRGYRLAWRSSWITSKFPDHPHMLRELGFYHALRGNVSKALKVTEKSCRIAESQGAKSELARSQLACAQYRCDLGIASSEEIETAGAEVDRFHQMVTEVKAAGHPLLT